MGSKRFSVIKLLKEFTYKWKNNSKTGTLNNFL